jgi:large repetitive protein
MKKTTQSLFSLIFLAFFLVSFSYASEPVAPPTITCPADITIPNDPGVCGAIVDYIGMASANDPEEGDISGAINTTMGPSSGSLFPIGITSVELSVTDSEGFTVTCEFIVTVNDTEPPTLTCPAAINTTNDPGVCGAIVSYTVDGDDNCEGGTTAGELTTTFANNNGQNGVMFDLTANGPEDVSINEFLGHVGPNFGGQDVTIWYMVGSHIGFESDDTPWIFHETVSATDNGNTGPGGNMVTPLSTPLVIPSGMTYGIFYETDGTENLDYTDGVATYSDAFLTFDSGSGKAMGTVHPFDGQTFTPRIFNGTIYYTTGTIEVMQTTGFPSGSLFPVGTTTNTFEITDAAGNTTSCSFDITVTDVEAPTITCPATITVDNDPGDCSAVVIFNVPTSDNCPGETLNQTGGIPSGSVFPVGTTTNSYEVTDAAGLTSTCTFDVVVNDTEGPVVNCLDITIQLDASGMATITAANVDGGSTDNCGVASTSIDTTTFDCNDVGTNNVLLSVTDINGNTSTCTAIVTVEDVDDPTAVCQDITIQLDAFGMATINPGDIDGGSSDVCSIGNLSVNIDSFDCSDIGPNDVILTVADGSGNTSTCTAVVTVEDTMAPTAVCEDITVQLGGLGSVTITPADINNGSFDNCGAVTTSINIDTFTCNEIGTNNVTLTVTDAYGNTSSCVAVVTVEELQNPTVICQDITVELDASGVATIIPDDIDGGSTDNCGIASRTINVDTFTCNNVGLINNVVLTVTDTAGNSSSCVAVVTVEDNIPITVLCQDITVTLDNNGEVSVDPEDVDAGSFDNCDITNMSLSQDFFTCADVGPNEVTLTVTNSNDETATCTAIITVQETILPPMAICQNVTAPLQPDGTVTVFPEALNNGSIGVGCNGTLSLDLDTFTCDDVGEPIQVTLTVMNENGVIDTCTAFINVVDSLDPVITCPDDQFIPMSDSYILPDYFATGDVVVTDNCENLTLSQLPAPGTELSPGIYNILMGATDISNNDVTCVFQLEIEGIALGVEDNEDIGSVLVYPNPASTYFAVANPQGISLEAVAIYDITGRLVKKTDLTTMGVEQRIDISELASATYMVIISSENGQLMKQLIKE